MTSATPTKRQLESWLKKFEAGELTKSGIEVDLLGITTAHGKKITKMWRDRLGVDTERKHPMVQENEYLRGILLSVIEASDVNGYVPWDVRDAALDALGEFETVDEDEFDAVLD